MVIIDDVAVVVVAAAAIIVGVLVDPQCRRMRANVVANTARYHIMLLLIVVAIAVAPIAE